MNGIAVIEEPGEKLSGVIASFLREKGKRDVTLLGESALCGGVAPAVVVVSPGAGAKRKSVPELSCDILLTPGKSPPKNKISAATLISYGMSDRDTLTLSSIDSDCLMVTLQRETTAVTGRGLDRQDIPIKRESGVSPEVMLAAAGALLLIGISPDEFISPPQDI
jgi:hypothetical protein